MKKLVLLFSLILSMVACVDVQPNQQKSDSGVRKATTQVKTDPSGNTIEQKNIIQRLERDNDLGSIDSFYKK